MIRVRPRTSLARWMRAIAQAPVIMAHALALLASATTAHAAPAARLQLAGWPLAQHEAEGWFAAPLRAPSDSSALAAALARAEARLQSAGWLEARISAEWSSDTSSLGVRVEPGARRRWGALELAVPGEDSARFAPFFHWPHGEPVDPARLDAIVERALAEAESHGHAWAQLAVTGWDADSDRVNVRLSGVRGPIVRVSGARVDGLHVTRRDVTERALGRLTGQAYDPAAARAAAARLAQLGVFSHAEFTGLEGGSQWQQGTLAFKVEEPRYNRFEGAAGVQGAGGLVGLLNLELGNLLGTARAAELGWQSRGGGRSDFRLRYVEPFLAGLPFRLEAALHQELQDSTFTRTRWGARLGHSLGTGDRIEAGIEEEHVVQSRGAVGTADLQNTVFAYERDGRDDLATPRRGSRLRVTGTGVFKRETLRAPVPGESNRRRARAGVAEVRAEWHRPLAGSTGLALELWGVGRFATEHVLADFERTPVGGAATLRGHDEEEFRADRVALSRLEYRWFPGTAGERVSLFWDHARLFTREPVLDALGATVGDRAHTTDADGVGLGLTLRAAGGLVDVDYGLAPGRGFLDGRIHLRLVSTF